MSSYTQLVYHFVWSPKHRQPILRKQDRPKLFGKMAQILRIKKCHLYIINGVDDHLHMLTHVHQSIPIASLVGEIKRITSIWIKEQKLFPGFVNWQIGYGAFTVNFKQKQRVIRYIENQEEHHREKEDFETEYIRMLEENGIEYKYEYLWE